MHEFRVLLAALTAAHRAMPVTFLISAVLIPLAAVVAALSPLLLRDLVDGFTQGDRRGGWGAAALLGAILATATAAGARGTRASLRLEEAVSLHADQAALARLDSVPTMDQLDDPRVQASVDRLQHGQQSAGRLVGALLQVGTSTGQLLISLLILSTVSPLFALAGMLVYGASRVEARSAQARAEGRITSQADRTVHRQLMDRLGRVEASRELQMLHGTLRLETARLGAHSRVLRKECADLNRGLAAQAAIRSIYTGGLAAAVVYLLATDGFATVGEFVMTIAAARRLTSDAQFMIRSSAVVHDRLADMRAISALSPTPAPSRHPSSSGSAVRLREMSYTYRGQSQPALAGVTLDIAPGEVLAVVGENGSGKTTLSHVVLGLLAEGCEGEVHRGDRRSVCLQDHARYPLPLAESITLGDPAGQLDAAIRVTGMSAETLERLSLLRPGEEAGISGGQWQRLALARASYFGTSAEVMVLDEPNSRLDAEVELDVLSRVLAAGTRSGAAVLLVTHRLGAARLADRIAVLRGGRMVEQGTHADLMARREGYYRIYQLQQAQYSTSAAVTEASDDNTRA